MEKFSFFEVEEAEARRVVKRMNGFELDGRRISVEFAQEKAEENDKKGSKGKGRKRRSTAQNRFMRESKKRTDKKKRK